MLARFLGATLGGRKRAEAISRGREKLSHRLREPLGAMGGGCGSQGRSRVFMAINVRIHDSSRVFMQTNAIEWK